MQTPMAGQKWVFSTRGVLRMEAPWCPVISGRIRHADPHGRAEVGDLHERGAQNEGSMVPGNFPEEPDMQTPMGGQKWVFCTRGVLRMGVPLRLVRGAIG